MTVRRIYGQYVLLTESNRLTALKTLTLRLRGSKTELEEMGEDVTDMATTTSQLQAKLLALTGGKVDIMLDANTFKNSTQILREMADAWEDMNDIQRASALELMGGKRQANVLSALIQNFDTVEEAIEASVNSAGSALKENERYLDSIQGKIDQFNNAMQAMWSNTLDSDVVKEIVAIGTEIIKIIDKIGLLKGALIALATYSMIKNKMGPIAFFKGIIEAGTQGITKLGDYVKGLKNVSFETSKLADVKETLTQAQLKEKLANTGLTDSVAEEIVAKTNLGKVTDELSASTLDAALRESGYSKEKRESIIQSIFDTQTTEENSNANRENATSNRDAGAAEDQRTKDTKENIDVTKEDTRVTEENTKKNNENAASNKKLGSTIKGLSGSIGNFVKQNASMFIAIGTTLLTIGLTKLVDSIVDTMDEANDRFDEAKNKLDSLNLEFKDLESQLGIVNDQITELANKTPLSFTDQEELLRLKDQSAELQRQIDLTKTLKEQAAVKVNDEATKAAEKYKHVGVDSGKTTGERVGNTVKTVGGIGVAVTGTAAMGAATTMATVGAANAWNPVGWIALAAAAITAIAAGVTYAVSESEEKIGESIDNMRDQYSKLQEEFNEARTNYHNDPTKKNKEKFEEAQEAFNSYQSNIASYMSEMDSYYSQIKANWGNATTEQKSKYNAWADKMDTWAVQTGGANAKSNTIDRIFGENAEGGFARARALIDDLKEKLKEAQETGDELAIAEALKNLEGFKLEGILSDEEVERLRSIGIYLYEAEDRFKDVVKAESKFVDSGLEDVAKNINKITDGLGALKSAFEEVVEKGTLSAKTMMELKDSLNIAKYEGNTNVTGAWNDYLEAMMSGVATTEEMTLATEKMADAMLEAELANGTLTSDKKWEYVAQFKLLGIDNADEFFDDLVQSEMVEELQSKLVPDRRKIVEAASAIEGHDMRSIMSTWSETELKTYAKEHGIVDGQITDEHRKEIAERYGLDIAEINKIADKLEEQSVLEQQIADIRAEQGDYLQWRNGDENGNAGIKALEQDVSDAENAFNKLKASVKGVLGEDLDLSAFNPDNYSWSSNYGAYVNNTDYSTMSSDNYNKLKQAYDALTSLQNQYQQKLEEGRINGWIDSEGNIIDKNFEEELKVFSDQVDTIQKEIEEKLTFDIQLKMDLQNKSQLVDDIQSTFDTLVSAQKEYDETGYITTDTLQTLLTLEPKYLDMLMNESGQLDLTKNSLYEVAKARITDMGIQQQTNILKNAAALASEGSAESLRLEIEVMENAIETGKDFVDIKMAEIQASLDARVAAKELTQAEADAFIAGTLNQIKAVQDSVKLVNDNIENTVSSAGNTAVAEVEDAFQKAMDYWENRIGANQSLYDQIQNDIDLLEKKGKIAGESYYQAQINVENERLEHLKAQRAEAQSYLDDVAVGSEKWWEIANTLNDIEGEIDDVTASIQDLNDAMYQVVHWTIFDEAHERFGNLTSQLSNVRDILSADEDSFFNDEGEWTEKGVAALGTYIQEIEIYKNSLADVEKELRELDIHDFDSEQEYYDKLTELTDKQHEYTKVVSDSEQAVVGMYESQVEAIEEYTDTLVESYKDYIDEVKNALDAERDLYDFKKRVKNESKNISELERRIASLSGSDNASDIAERRRLESQLFEAKETLNETYYDHSKQAQEQALDEEATAYEESMTRYVDDLRTKLDEAMVNMEAFMANVSNAVMLNAETIKTEYENTGLVLDKALIDPWTRAMEKVKEFSGEKGLGMMNAWTTEGGAFGTFASQATPLMKSPFEAGKTAMGEFSSKVSSGMSAVYTSIKTNVESSIIKLNELKAKYKEINDSNIRPPSTGSGDGYGNENPPVQKKYRGVAILKIGSDTLRAEVVANSEADAKTGAMMDIAGEYEKRQKAKGVAEWVYEPSWQRVWRNKVVTDVSPMYAKGTTGTTRDEWAITDEPKFGDELVLVPGKDGNLSFMRKGTGIVPADLTQKLFELAQIPTSDLMRKNITAIVPDIKKTDISNTFSFDSLVHVDHCDQSTLKELEKMVDNKINDFGKQMNYSLKKFTR